MSKRMTPEKVIDIIWFSVALTFCWPLPINSSGTRILVHKILQISSVISACMLLLPLLYSIYLHLDDIIIVSECICLFLGVSQAIVQSIICLINHDSLQHVVEEMIICVKQAREYEREIFSKHIARCSVFYASSIMCIYLAATAFSIGPAILPLSFPSEAEYPFRVNYTPVYVIIYMQQSILSYQCVAHICLSMFGSLLFWFTAARFQCLAMELKRTADVRTLIVCVEKQLHLRRYAKEVVDNFRFIVLYAIGVSTSALTLCGIILLVDVPPMVKIQFVTVCLTVLTEIYVYAWSADYMKDMSINVSRSAYDIIWYKQKLEMQKNLLTMLECQEPITLSVSCIIPELSLRYFCSVRQYLSNTFSIFTTLRIVIEDNAE
ncbi:uncharacterized protein LOC126868508 [Bombus huntii]|uniref:uncharacterized protein LOC126868508 n=1 Tax=Bombus huntii TaxID=85661 RepID=UPI0021AB095D|nr:uncharacterized protein LOC126868508 [Bombus huntii]